MSVGKNQSIGLSATCTDDSITLHFDRPGSYRIWQKRPADTSWGAPIWERPLDTEFVDQNGIAPGVAFEYKVVEMMTGATSYILAGSKIPLIDSRGKLVLIVDARFLTSLKDEIRQWINDAVGDGWTVVRHQCRIDDTPDYVKGLIRAEWEKDKENVKTVVLFGNVPVPYSGDCNYDGHPDHTGAFPADCYYGSMTGTWTDSTVNNTSTEKPWNHNVPGDGKFDQSIIPSDLELMVGRIDFSNMVNFQNKTPPRSELDLLRAYLARNHAWRTGQTAIVKRAAICDNFSDRPFAGAAWRMFPTCVGDQIQEVSSALVSELADKFYLLAYAAGGGGWASCVGFGDSDELSVKSIKCPFLFLLGSYFGDFDNESGLMKSALASGALAVRLAGNPNFFGHRMGLGGTIGESHLLSANNGTVYPPTGAVEDGPYSPISDDGRGVHQCLLGDPTLIPFPVQPVTNFDGTVLAAHLALSWTPVDEAIGYHVCRSASPNGPFTRLTTELEVRNSFMVADHFEGLLYMVRAVKLVATPSGSYYAASCGTFWPPVSAQPQPQPQPSPTMSKATFIRADTTTQGNWQEPYGDDGAFVAGGERAPAQYAVVQYITEKYEWSNPGNDPRALKAHDTGAQRVAAVWYHAVGFTFEIKSDALPHRLALYFLDWDRQGRSQRVEVLDGATGSVLDRRDVTSFGDGVWLLYDFQGSVKLRLTKLTGPNAVLSAIMFDPAAPVTPGPAPSPVPALRRLVLESADSGKTWTLKEQS